MVHLIAHRPQACIVLPIRVHFDPKLIVPFQMEQFPILLASTANVVHLIAHRPQACIVLQVRVQIVQLQHVL